MSEYSREYLYSNESSIKKSPNRAHDFDRNKNRINKVQSDIELSRKEYEERISAGKRRESEARTTYTSEPKPSDVNEMIEKKIHDMKQQLGLENHKTPTERYLDRMKEINDKLNKEFKPKSISSKFDNTFRSDDTASYRKHKPDRSEKYDSAEKIPESDYKSEDELYKSPLGESMTRIEHQKIVEAEMKKLENKFFNMFQQEKREIIDKTAKEHEEVQSNIKKKYESRIKDLEIRNKGMDSLLDENEKLRRENNELKKTVAQYEEYRREVEKLRLSNDTLRERLEEAEYKKKTTKEELHDADRNFQKKIEELETEKNTFQVELKTTKRELLRIQDEFREKKEETDRLMNKLNKYKAEVEEVTERSKHVETDREALLRRIRELEREIDSLKEKERRTPIVDRSRIHDSRLRTAGDDSRLNISREESREKTPYSKYSSLKNKEENTRNEEIISDLRNELQTLVAELKDVRKRNVELSEANRRLETKSSSDLQVRRTSESKLPSDKTNNDLKVLSLQNEIDFWRNKCELLSTKYVNIMRKMKDDLQKMKIQVFDDYDQFRKDTIDEVKSLKKKIKKPDDEEKIYRSKPIEDRSPISKVKKTKTVTKKVVKK